MTDGDLRIEVKSRSDILLRSELVFSNLGSSLKTRCARGWTSGLLGTTVPALKDRSSKKLSRSAANFSKALSKSKSRRGGAAALMLASVIVESLEVELFRINPGVGEREGDSVLLEALDSRFVGEDEPFEEPLKDPLLCRGENPFVDVGTSKEDPCASSSASIATKSCSVKLFLAGFESCARCSP